MEQQRMSENQYNSYQGVNPMGQPPMNDNQYNGYQGVNPMGQPPMNDNQYNSYQGVNPMGQPPMNDNQYNGYQGVNPMGQPLMNDNQYNSYQGVNPMGQPPMNGNQYNGYQEINYNGQPPMNGNPIPNDSVNEEDSKLVDGGWFDYIKFRAKWACVGGYFSGLWMLFTSLIFPGLVMITGCVLATPKLFKMKKVPSKTASIMLRVGMVLIVLSLFMAAIFAPEGYIL